MGNIFGQGVDQSDLKTLLDLIITNFNGMLSDLDSSGATDVNYNSLWAIPTTLVLAGGMNQGDLVYTLDTTITNFNAVLTKLDADTLVNNTNYSSTLVMTDVVNNFPTGKIQNNGMNLGNVVYLLNTIVTQFNLLLVKLSADSGVNDSTLTADWAITDTVNEAGCSN